MAVTTTSGGLFSGMISPLVGMGIKGVVWWQGENEAGMANPICNYTSGGLRELIRSWRQKWGEGDFPFLFVQLQQGIKQPDSLQVDEVRDCQMQALSEPATGMASCFDSSSGLHPQNKIVAGLRLASCARAVAYGENIEGMGPIYSGFTLEGNKIRVQFTHIGNGLLKKDPGLFQESNNLAVGALVLSSSSDAHAPFTIAGADNVFKPADAVIDGNTVVVSAPSVSVPKNVRYALEDQVGKTKTPLYNANNFPASMFRTDTWAGLGSTATRVRQGQRSTFQENRGASLADVFNSETRGSVRIFDYRGGLVCCLDLPLHSYSQNQLCQM
jgi:sialate O-acetylesterase